MITSLGQLKSLCMVKSLMFTHIPHETTVPGAGWDQLPFTLLLFVHKSSFAGAHQWPHRQDHCLSCSSLSSPSLLFTFYSFQIKVDFDLLSPDQSQNFVTKWDAYFVMPVVAVGQMLSTSVALLIYSFDECDSKCDCFCSSKERAYLLRNICNSIWAKYRWGNKECCLT